MFTLPSTCSHPPPSVRAILIQTPHADMISVRAMRKYNQKTLGNHVLKSAKSTLCRTQCDWEQQTPPTHKRVRGTSTVQLSGVPGKAWRRCVHQYDKKKNLSFFPTVACLRLQKEKLKSRKWLGNDPNIFLKKMRKDGHQNQQWDAGRCRTCEEPTPAISG